MYQSKHFDQKFQGDAFSKDSPQLVDRASIGGPIPILIGGQGLEQLSCPITCANTVRKAGMLGERMSVIGKPHLPK
ncbi:hypothetical protein D3C87_1250550 [compost metagenome]